MTQLRLNSKHPDSQHSVLCLHQSSDLAGVLLLQEENPVSKVKGTSWPRALDVAYDVIPQHSHEFPGDSHVISSLRFTNTVSLHYFGIKQTDQRCLPKSIW